MLISNFFWFGQKTLNWPLAVLTGYTTGYDLTPSMYWDSVRLLSYSITLKIFNNFELFGLKRQKVELSYGVTIGLAVHRTGYLESIHNNKLVCDENPGYRFPWSIFLAIIEKKAKSCFKATFCESNLSVQNFTKLKYAIFKILRFIYNHRWLLTYIKAHLVIIMLFWLLRGPKYPKIGQ